MNKQFFNFIGFIQAVKSGKRVMILSKDYVVLSRNLYDSLTEKKGLYIADEIGEFTQEQIDFLLSRIGNR